MRETYCPAKFESETMTDDADPTEDSGHRAEDVPPPMPRWVKSLVLAVLAVLVIAVVVMLIVGGEHGPSRHGAAPTSGGQPAAITLR